MATIRLDVGNELWVCFRNRLRTSSETSSPKARIALSSRCGHGRSNRSPRRHGPCGPAPADRFAPRGGKESGAAPFGSRMSGSWISRLAPCAAVGSGESARCGRRTRRPRRTAARPRPLARISCGLAAAPRSVAGPRVTARALVACGSGSRQPRSLRWRACLSLTQAGDLPAIAREPGQVRAQRSRAHRFICL